MAKDGQGARFSLLLEDLQLEIIDPTLSRPEKSCKHEVTVAFRAGSEIEAITIRQRPAFHSKEIYMIYDIPAASADFSVVTTESMDESLLIKLSESIKPVVVSGGGQTYGETTEESEIVRVWCTLPWKALPINSLLSINHQKPYLRFKQLENLLDVSSRSSRTASTLSTSNNSPGELSEYSKDESNNDVNNEGPMWLDLRSNSAFEGARNVVISQNRPGHHTQRQKHQFKAHHRPYKQKTSESVGKYGHKASSSQACEDFKIQRWSKFAEGDQVRPECAISKEIVSSLGYHHSKSNRNDYWQAERKKTRWRTMKQPIDNTKIANLDKAEQWRDAAAANETSLVVTEFPVSAASKLTRLDRIILQHPQTVRAGTDTYNSTSRGNEESNGSVVEQVTPIVAQKSTLDTSDHDPSSWTQPTNEHRIRQSKKQHGKKRGGALFDSF